MRRKSFSLAPRVCRFSTSCCSSAGSVILHQPQRSSKSQSFILILLLYYFITLLITPAKFPTIDVGLSSQRYHIFLLGPLIIVDIWINSSDELTVGDRFGRGECGESVHPAVLELSTLLSSEGQGGGTRRVTLRWRGGRWRRWKHWNSQLAVFYSTPATYVHKVRSVDTS